VGWSLQAALDGITISGFDVLGEDNDRLGHAWQKHASLLLLPGAQHAPFYVARWPGPTLVRRSIQPRLMLPVNYSCAPQCAAASHHGIWMSRCGRRAGHKEMQVAYTHSSFQVRGRMRRAKRWEVK
jgi:hypothetical protein